MGVKAVFPVNWQRPGSRQILHTERIVCSRKAGNTGSQRLSRQVYSLSGSHLNLKTKVGDLKFQTKCNSLHWLQGPGNSLTHLLYHTSAYLIYSRYTTLYSSIMPSSSPPAPLGLHTCSLYLECLFPGLTQLPWMDFQLFSKASLTILFLCPQKRCSMPAHPTMPLSCT